MSLQAGVRYFDGRPVDPVLVARIARYLDQFSQDGGGQYVAPGLAMIQRSLHVTPEDTDERQPRQSERGRVMTWDGRLDNRDDLLLQLRPAHGGVVADAELVMAALDAWGEDALVSLIGDWSLVQWDARAGTVTLASDYAGTRALYYSGNERFVHWSTSLAELVDRLDLRDELDSRFIVGYLTGALPPEVTPYRGVSSVPPGARVLWSADGRADQHRFWQLPDRTLRYAAPHDYENHFRSVFADAIRVRLRSSRPVWAELSGGFDSSSIVCMADRVTASRPGVACVETVSYVTDTSPESDERPFIGAVEEQRGRRGHHVRAETLIGRSDASWSWLTPLHPSDTPLGIRELVMKNGGRVLMTGNPGDLVMMNYPEDTGVILEALARLQVFRAASGLHQWCRASRKPIWPLLYQVAMEALPVRAADRLIRAELRQHSITTRDIVRGAAQAFHLTDSAAQMWREDATRRASRLLSIRTDGRRTLVKGLLEWTERRLLQTAPECAGLLYTHPFIDRPLIEFMLAIPPNVACQPGQPRMLMKAALADILPSRIARRFSKGYVDPFNIRMLRATMPHDLTEIDSFFLVEQSFIDPSSLRRALEAIRLGSCRAVGNIEAVLKLERWLRTRKDQFIEHGRTA